MKKIYEGILGFFVIVGMAFGIFRFLFPEEEGHEK